MCEGYLMTRVPGMNLDGDVPEQEDASACTRRGVCRVTVHRDEVRASKARVRARLLMELVRRDMEASPARQPALTTAD